MYVAKPNNLLIGGGGDFIIADGFHRKVLAYARSGGLRRQFGNAGKGQGQFQDPFMAVILSDTVLGVLDPYRADIQLFDWRDGQFLRSQHLDLSIVMSANAIDGSVWLGGVSPIHQKGLARWDLASDSVSYMVELPRSYRRNRTIRNSWIHVTHAARDSFLVVGFSADQEILVVDSLGHTVDSFVVPHVRRRGIPTNFESKVSATTDPEAGEAVALLSMLLQIGVAPDGALLFAHYDGRMVGRIPVATIYVSVVSPDLKTACVDAVVPQQHETIMPVRFQGDTLFAIEQLVDASLRAQTTAVGYRIDRSSCDWLPVIHRANVPLGR